MRKIFVLNLTCLLLAVIVSLPSFGQKPQVKTSSDIQLALQKLEVLGSVLYLAAHPDDENTRLIAWLANDQQYRTAYLSLTRGDGGQNLIGAELRERLGIIRTQELLQARKIDGGTQFFTRANDFGFSKHPDETFEIWNKEAVLADVVWVIRKFRPDAIITRFSTEPGGTHGHHTASAILAEEAFKAAADPKRFPEQLKYLQTWQPKRLLWNTSSWFFRGREAAFDSTAYIKLGIGGYNPLLGKSYPELAAESRSMHRSQGFGAALSRENTVEYLKPILGDAPTDGNLLSGIQTSWNRIKGGDRVSEHLSEIRHKFAPLAPWKSLPQLIQLHKIIKALPEDPYKEAKLQELDEIIRASAGLFVEATTPETGAAPANDIAIKLEAVNRAPVDIKLLKLSVPELAYDSAMNLNLLQNQPLILRKSLAVPPLAAPSQPYWLVKEPSKGMFHFDKMEMSGEAQNPAPVHARMLFSVEGHQLTLKVPLVHKHVEPAFGEVYQPFSIVPPLMVTPLQQQLIFASDAPQELALRVRAGKEASSGFLSLQLPKGWRAEPATIPFEGLRKGEERNFKFKVIPAERAETAIITAQATLDGKRYQQGYETIVAPHFPVQTLFPDAKVGVTRLDLKRNSQKIGYIMGAGDAVPEYLSQVGYDVSLLDPASINARQLSAYDAVVLGVRAFNTQDALKHTKEALEAYARAGGVVLIQYNTNHELVSQQIGPFPLQLGRGRVTDETAAVKILAPNHPALNYPNKITESDFEGWVQERGLYFADSWASQWQPLIASHDKGEQPLEGGLLVAAVGDGFYVYSGYSWFRQLPAGVPGAYRLLANLLALGKNVPK